MASINIFNLRLADSNRLNDSGISLKDLGEREMAAVTGGISESFAWSGVLPPGKTLIVSNSSSLSLSGNGVAEVLSSLSLEVI